MRKPESIQIHVEVDFNEKDGFFHSHISINGAGKECMAISSVRSFDARKAAEGYVSAINKVNTEFASLFFEGAFEAGEPERPETTDFGHEHN
jgi:hypothetical protein